MSRYIDADKLKKEGWHLVRERQNKRNSYIEGMDLDCVPTADVTEVKRGRWDRSNPHWDYENKYVVGRCSNCGFSVHEITNYCPNCGALMQGEE